MRAKDRLNLITFTVALFIASRTIQCIAFSVQCFYLPENKDLSVLLPTRDKGIAIMFKENHFYKNKTIY